MEIWSNQRNKWLTIALMPIVILSITCYILMYSLNIANQDLAASNEFVRTMTSESANARLRVYVLEKVNEQLIEHCKCACELKPSGPVPLIAPASFDGCYDYLENTWENSPLRSAVFKAPHLERQPR